MRDTYSLGGSGTGIRAPNIMLPDVSPTVPTIQHPIISPLQQQHKDAVTLLPTRQEMSHRNKNGNHHYYQQHQHQHQHHYQRNQYQLQQQQQLQHQQLLLQQQRKQQYYNRQQQQQQQQRKITADARSMSQESVYTILIRLPSEEAQPSNINSDGNVVEMMPSIKMIHDDISSLSLSAMTAKAGVATATGITAPTKNITEIITTTATTTTTTTTTTLSLSLSSSTTATTTTPISITASNINTPTIRKSLLSRDSEYSLPHLGSSRSRTSIHPTSLIPDEKSMSGSVGETLPLNAKVVPKKFSKMSQMSNTVTMSSIGGLSAGSAGESGVAPREALAGLNVSGSSAINRNLAKKKKKSQEKRQESKAAKTLSAILLSFIITWTPYNILVLIKPLTTCSDCIPDELWDFFYALCYINSTINPVCYALCNATFRRTYIRILTCKWHTRNREGMVRGVYN